MHKYHNPTPMHCTHEHNLALVHCMYKYHNQSPRHCTYKCHTRVRVRARQWCGVVVRAMRLFVQAVVRPFCKLHPVRCLFCGPLSRPVPWLH